jgi:hypothetical protein
VSVIAIVLLAAAVLLLASAEWPRLSQKIRPERGRGRPRRRTPRTPHLRVVEPDSDPDEFQRAVERDLANLPTYDPRAKRD